MKMRLKIILSLFISWSLYCAFDYFTVITWDNSESMIIKIISAGEESEVIPDYEDSDEEEDVFPTLEREIIFRALSGSDTAAEHKIKAVRLKGTGLDVQPGGNYLLVWDIFEDGSIQYSIADKFRVSSVIFFIVLICMLLVAFSGKRGLLALTGLFLSIAVLLFAMIPLMIKGWKPVPLAIISVFIIATLTVLFVVKHQRYRLVALLGSLGGVLGGFLVAWIVVYFWQLTGLAGEGAALLASTVPDLDMQGILLASVLIGSIGAVLDVGISITASMSELVDYDEEIPLDRLLISGLNVGNEVLGSMINTLILAYLGSSLPMAVLIASAGVNFIGLLNDPYVAQEIVQSIAGTLGLLFTIPATAFFFVIQEGIRRREN